MSWITKIQSGLTIITGDRRSYKPFYIDASASKSIEFNNTLFEFVNLPGTLADRRLPKGERFTLEFGFQGLNHLEEAAEFVASAKADTKYWTLQHPYYGTIYVQPFSINIDNSGLNVSKFSVPVIETITTDVINSKIDPIDSISIKKLQLDDLSSLSITATISEADKISVKNTNQKNYNFTVPTIKIPEEFHDYINLFSTANAAIDSVLGNATIAFAATTSLITAPAKFASSVNTRLTNFKAQFDVLRQTVVGSTSVSSKQIYQSLASNIISSMCLVASLPIDGDYSNAANVKKVIGTINDSYTSFLIDLDSIQTLNGGGPFSFIPNFELVNALNDLINTTISFLYNEAIGSRVEHSIIVENDTSILLLAHRFYGLDPLDKNVKELIENNNLSIEEYILIPKGRKIVYYI